MSPHTGRHHVGAEAGSYPEVASRAVRNAAQQSPSPVYGYLRSGQQQKIYLFGAIADAQGWLTSLAHSQAQPYEYVAVFAATDLSQPVSGLESYGHAFVSGDAQVGSFWPFLAGLPLGLLGGYAYRGWQDKHPGQWIPGIAGDPSVGAWVDMVGPQVGGPWVDMVGPQVGGPWVDMVGPQVGGPWVDMVGDTWVDITGDGAYTIGGPWVDVVGSQMSSHVDERALRHHQWPQIRSLIQSAINETSQAATQGPAEAYVWSLDPPGPSTMPGVVLEGMTFVTPFSSHAEALDYMRSRIQTPHVALALFDRRSPHWPNPVNWTKSNDPTYEPIIAAQAAKAPGPRMAGWSGGRGDRVSSALDDLRSRAQSIANKRAGQVVGVVHTTRDNLWHAFAFGSQDDADDWLDSATRDQGAYTYAAYFDKADATWPRAVIEKIGGTRTRALTSGAVVGAALDDFRSHAQSLAGARAGRAVGTLRSTDGIWHSLGFHSLDDAVDWLQSATRDRSRFVYAAIFEKSADGSAFFQGEEVGPALSRRGITTTSGERGHYNALAA